MVAAYVRLFTINESLKSSYSSRQFLRILFSFSEEILDKIVFTLLTLLSGIRIIDVSHNGWGGNSKVSANNIGMLPNPNDSQNLILLGPVPDGHNENLELANIVL